MSDRPFDHLVVADSGRVRIRRKHPGDALNDFHWRRDPEIARFDAALPATTTFSEFFLQFERDLAGLEPCRRIFALETADGVHIGNVMYYNADWSSQTAEFGISIALPEYRATGLGTAATVAFLRFAWETLPFRLIYLHTLEWNERAISCFRRAGFNATARVYRKQQWFIRMEARREWWLMWDMEGRFDAYRAAGPAIPSRAGGGDAVPVRAPARAARQPSRQRR